MKNVKKIFVLIFTAILTLNLQAKEAETSVEKPTQTGKSWVIEVSASGGFAGMSKTMTLKSNGELTNRNLRTKTSASEKVSVAEVGKLIKTLKPENLVTRTVKTPKIYDGVFGSFKITIDGKTYELEKTSFGTKSNLILTKKQKEIFAKLKDKLTEIGAVIK